MLARIFFVFFSFCLTSVSALSLHLINDSPFNLVATVQAANGGYLGDASLQPGQDVYWRADDNLLRTFTQSLTPLMVIWKCSTEGYYGVCTSVSPGATIAASMCSGSKTCAPPKKDPGGTQ